MPKPAPSRSVYDYPEYFDLTFADETEREADFIAAAAKKYCDRPVKRIFEPGCGGGRLVVELAKRGYYPIGLDLSPAAVVYTQSRLRKAKLRGEVSVCDMCDFSFDRPVDAAVCPFNTFRHLLSEDEAIAHLQAVLAALRPGGIYILGLHLLPGDAADECVERWSATRGKTRVTCTLRVTETDLKQRFEHIRLSMRVRSPQQDLKLRSEFVLRRYSVKQMRTLLSKVPQFELCDVYDFWYDISEPLTLSEEMSDTLLILRKRA